MEEWGENTKKRRLSTEWECLFKSKDRREQASIHNFSASHNKSRVKQNKNRWDYHAKERRRRITQFIPERGRLEGRRGWPEQSTSFVRSFPRERERQRHFHTSRARHARSTDRHNSLHQAPVRREVERERRAGEKKRARKREEGPFSPTDRQIEAEQISGVL